MRVLITGGAGLVGRPLARRLGRSHEVLAVDVDVLDVTDPDQTTSAVREFRPDHVAHLAAMTDVDGCERDPAAAERVNAFGARNIALACREVGARMLYVSTDYVFDGEKETPYRADDPTGPLSHYGRSKLQGEEFTRQFAPEWRIVRCQSIYGAGRKSFVDAILARARSGQPLKVVTDQRISPSYAEDVAEALEAVLLRAPPGVCLASNDGSCTWHECAVEALRLSGLGHVAVAGQTAAELGRPAPRPRNSVFDLDGIEAATGLRPRSWQDALAAYLSRSALSEEISP